MLKQQKKLHRAKILGTSVMVAGGLLAAASFITGFSYPCTLEYPVMPAQVANYYSAIDQLNKLRFLASSATVFSQAYPSNVQVRLENAFKEEVEKKKNLEEAVRVQEQNLELICPKIEVENFEAKREKYCTKRDNSYTAGMLSFLLGLGIFGLGSLYRDSAEILEEKLNGGKIMKQQAKKIISGLLLLANLSIDGLAGGATASAGANSRRLRNQRESQAAYVNELEMEELRQDYERKEVYWAFITWIKTNNIVEGDWNEVYNSPITKFLSQRF